MRVGIYLRKGKFYIPVKAKTDVGYYLDIEPVEQANIFESDKFTCALSKVIAIGNPSVAAPDRKNFPRFVVLKHAGVNSLRQFEKDSTYWMIESAENHYKIIPYKARPDSGWEEETERVETYPAKIGLAKFLEIVVKTIQESVR